MSLHQAKAISAYNTTNMNKYINTQPFVNNKSIIISNAYLHISHIRSSASTAKSYEALAQPFCLLRYLLLEFENYVSRINLQNVYLYEIVLGIHRMMHIGA